MTDRICEWQECPRVLSSHGNGRPARFCPQHKKAAHAAWWTDENRPAGTVEGCKRPFVARAMCHPHYKVWARANGMEKPHVETDQRRDRHQRRRALLAGHRNGGSVFLTDILERDGAQCRLCGQEIDMTLAYPDPFSRSVDHIIPLSRGGAHEPTNCQLAHLRCNLSKGAKLAA